MRELCVALVLLGMLAFSPFVAADEIPLQNVGNTYWVSVRLNEAIILPFVLDTGASDVTIPGDVVSTLLRTGTLTKDDLIGHGSYIQADGSALPGLQFRLREVEIGNQTIRNVVGHVSPVRGEPLLGQSFLSRLPPWTIDYRRHVLSLNAPTKTPSRAHSAESPSTPVGTPPPPLSPVRTGSWVSSTYPGTSGEVRLTDVAVKDDGSVYGRIYLTGSRCAQWANFSGRFNARTVMLSVNLGQCGVTEITLSQFATG